jgi:hypothetical protein
MTSAPERTPGIGTRRGGQWPDTTPPKTWPVYGTPEFYAADPFGKEKRFSVFEAAERWRLQGVALDQLDDADWYAYTFGDARRTAARLLAATNRLRSFREIRDERAKPRPAHVLRATPGWPPIAIPGKPGHYLTYREQKAA